MIFLTAEAAQNLIQPYADGRADGRTEVNVLGLTSISGPPEAWLIEGHDSLASLEAVDSALSLAGSRGDAPLDYLPLSATAIAVYRPGLRHRPEEAIRPTPAQKSPRRSN